MFDHWLSLPCKSSGLLTFAKLKDALSALKDNCEQEATTPTLLTPNQYKDFEAAGLNMKNYRTHEMCSDLR